MLSDESKHKSKIVDHHFLDNDVETFEQFQKKHHDSKRFKPNKLVTNPSNPTFVDDDGDSVLSCLHSLVQEKE